MGGYCMACGDVVCTCDEVLVGKTYQELQTENELLLDALYEIRLYTELSDLTVVNSIVSRTLEKVSQPSNM
jgi:hypothetical protein